MISSTYDDGITLTDGAQSIESCWRIVRADVPPLGKTLQAVPPAIFLNFLGRKEDNRPLGQTGTQQETLLI